MKILIIHYKYSISGGPERYLFNITRLLEKKGHKIIHFSLDLIDNKDSKHSIDWPKIPFTNGEFHLNRVKNLSFFKKIIILINSIYSKIVYKKLDIFIKKEKPDIAYLLLFLGKLSPSIIDACKKNNIPVVSRISDFSMICLNSILYDGSNICQSCINGNFIHGIKKKCFKSYSNSFAQYLNRKYFFLNKYQNLIDLFFVPSKNSLKIYSNSELFKNSKMIHLPTFVDEPEVLDLNIIEKRFHFKKLIYWGRISEEKDFKLLIDAITQLTDLNIKLVIIGFDKNVFSEEILNFIKLYKISHLIETLPFRSKDKIKVIADDCSAFIFPSKIFDNQPQSVLEALSFGLPVIAPRLGSLKEIVNDSFNGYLYEKNCVNSLSEKIRLIFSDKNIYSTLSNNAIKNIKNEYNSEKHYNIIYNVFKQLNNAQ